MTELASVVGDREIVVIANRLPVDRVESPDGSTSWRTSPGGLVTAMELVVQHLGCRWIGWAGNTDEVLEPFTVGEMRLIPVTLSAAELSGYYEGFSNGTLWPLYHDVIEAPEYHREWWDDYVRVNRRFAEAAAAESPEGALVWVHDYQLQLVPAMLRELRPDLVIAFFLHIPFPNPRLFAQLPWRRRVIDGMLGADVIGFQQQDDAVSFRLAAERYGGALAHGNRLYPASDDSEPVRSVLAQEFPISIDVAGFTELAARPEIRRRAAQIRRDLGDPDTILLGVDRLDYTKGIRHRLKAFSELLAEGEASPQQTVMVQVASPSRGRVAAYRRLREEVETTVGRINGDYGSIGHTPVVYLHQGFSRDEMAALYLAADVLVVTPLRDGMNLVAKEYVACRMNNDGVLVLSEFAGAADELRSALLVNPHDIDGVKATLLRAMHMPEREQQRRMQSLRESIARNDVTHWAENFLRAAAAAGTTHASPASDSETDTVRATRPILLPSSLDGQLRRLATAPKLIVACDFDGTLAPIVRRAADARILDRAQRALTALASAAGVSVALVSGRALDSLLATGIESAGWTLSGSHGLELRWARIADADAEPSGSVESDSGPTDTEEAQISSLQRRLTRVFGPDPDVDIERKPFGIAIHTRRVRDTEAAEEILDAASRFGAQAGFHSRDGKKVREFTLREGDKGSALAHIRSQWPSAPMLFIGDDLTDEDVFRTLGIDDLGVKVGAGETAAHARVSDPHAVAALLARLVELRTGRIIGDRGPR